MRNERWRSQFESASALTTATRVIPVAAALFVLAGGITSILGWALDVNRLIDWDQDGITIKFNAAVCVTLAGLGLLLSSLGPQMIWPVRAIGVVLTLIAAATLTQHLTGVDFYIDTLFFDEEPNAAATAAPGRMGIPASSALSALGVGFVFLTISRLRRYSAYISVVTLAVTGLSLTGYLYGASQLYALPRLTGIALQTATMVAASSIGMMFLIKEYGPVSLLVRTDAGGRIFRGLSLPVIVIALTMGSLRVFLQNEGFVDTAFGTAARTLVEIILLLALLGITAERLSRSESDARETEGIRAENETHRRIASAQESERRRIARDVHDHIGQQLTGLRLRLESLLRRDGMNEELRSEMQRLRDEARKLDLDLSMLIWQMRPSILDSHGLASALNSFIREWSANHDIETEFQAPASESRLAPEIETNLYRIIQEALNNVLKHASARRVNITMNYIGDEAVVVIEDDGSGFDADSDPIHSTESSGFGILGMKERAALVGGKLEIESTPGDGTTIMVRVPRTARTKVNGAARTAAA